MAGHRGTSWRIIDAAGRVFCARQQIDVDVERCLDCPYSLDVDLATVPGAIKCKPPYVTPRGLE